MIRHLKSLLPVPWKSRIAYAISRRQTGRELTRGDRPKAVVALAADYGNLGDIAITFAQTRLIQSCLPDHDIVDFPCARTFSGMKDLEACCSPYDVITIVGGGNMCDLYASLEDARRFVVGRFRRNRIISFPQTMDFSETPRGRRELERSRRAYGRHRALTLFARESVSYGRMRREFPDADVRLAPDVVLSLDAGIPDGVRRGTLLCIRADRESAIGAPERQRLVRALEDALPDVSITDTVLPAEGRLSLEERTQELERILQRVSAAEVVVTDRLHGAIFAAITGTPCVALRNSNHKIAATVGEWLVGLPHVRMVETPAPAAIVEATAAVLGVPAAERGRPRLSGQFSALRNATKEAAKR